jgi:hypothetical protein
MRRSLSEFEMTKPSAIAGYLAILVTLPAGLRVLFRRSAARFLAALLF